MNRHLSLPLTAACFLLLPIDLARAAASTSACVLLGFAPADPVLTLLASLGAVVLTGGAAALAYFVRNSSGLKQLEAKNKAATIKALDALDQKIYGGKGQPIDKLRANLASLCERDPAFNPEAFGKMAETLFVKLQTARSSGNLAPLRPRLTDGLWKNLATQLSIDAIHQRRIVSRDVSVQKSAIVGVELGDDFDAIHITIVSRLRAVDVAMSTAPDKLRQLLDRAPIRECAETWTFLRRPLCDGDRKSSFKEERCPLCAVPLPQSGTTTCQCGAILNSGGSDWVLSQIIESTNFRIPNDDSIDGFARLMALDPAINRRVLEDRAQLVFWSRLDALAQNQMYAFARFAQPQALAQFSSEDAGLSIGRVLGGRVDLVQVIADIDFERAWFSVRWQQLRRDPSGRNAFDVTHTQLMQLARKNGGSTLSKVGLSTGRCASCGTEVSANGECKCAACGKQLSDDWSLVELISPETFQARSKATKQTLTRLADRIGVIADQWDRRRAIAMMVAVVRADGNVSDKERKLLAMCMERWELEPMLLKAFLAAPMDDISSIQPKSIDEARMLFRALAAAALADGHIDESEQKLLKMMAKHLKLAPDEDYEIIKSLGPVRG